MTRGPFKYGEPGSGERDPRVNAGTDPKTAGTGGAGFKFGFPGINEADGTYGFDWFDWNALINSGQANVPKGGVGISGSGTFGGGGGAPSSAAPTAGAAPAGVGGVGGATAGAGAGAGAGGATVAGGTAAAGNSWLPWINAALGAYGSYEQAQAANKSKTSRTDSMTTQTPYGPTLPHIDRILEEQARLYSQGPQTVGGRGGGGGGGGGGGAAGSSARSSAEGIFNEAAQRGFDMRDNEAARLATGGMGAILGGDGFEGYNRYGADLADRLGGVSHDRGIDLLLGFLGENDRAGGGSSDPRLVGAGRSAGLGGGGVVYRGGGGVGSSGVPDATGSGLFGTEIRKLLDEGAAEEEIAAVMDALRGEEEENFWRQVADIDAAAQGAGRGGMSDWYAARRANAGEELSEALVGAGANLRYQDVLNRRDTRLGALGQVNARDLGAMQDATQRAGINSSAGSAAASLALQEKLGLRSQDLQAISALLGHDLAGLGMLGDLSDRRSTDALGAMSLAPGIAGIELGGIDAALGAGAGLGDIYGTDQSTRAAMADTNLRRQMFNANAGQQSLDNYLRTVLGIGSMGGTVNTQGTNVVPGAGYNTGAALGMGALGGYMTGVGMQNGGNRA